jgi:diaminopimelate epimerase
MSPAGQLAILAGAGNTFAVLDARDATHFGDRAELAKHWCANPPGASGLERLDGVLFVEPGEDGADRRMVVHNADGSRPETCGNGLRCVARFARENGLVTSDVLTLATDAGVAELELLRENGEIVGARANMGAPRRIEREVELRGEFGALRATLVDMGNPHCVLFVDEPASAPVHELGATLEHHARFPERTNVEFTAVRGAELEVRVWERGVGETAACGTGACAAAVAAILAGRARSPVDVQLPGGRLRVEWDGRGAVWLSGPCEVLWRGPIPTKGALDSKDVAKR